jgi:hypothetical protein
MAPQDPKDGMQIPQATGPFLDVGLQLIGGILEAGVALLLLLDLGIEEGGWMPHVFPVQGMLQGLLGGLWPCQQACFEK